MSTTKKLIKTAQRLLSNILQLGKRLTKQVMNWLLRNLFIFRRQPNTSQAGFVLPTVIMVMLVVTLLTTAILFRSFDRAKNASNVRVNEATLNAATPALDRARAKIDKLLADPTLPRGTPGDSAFKNVIEDSKRNEYNLPGETRLEIKDGTESSNTAWRFPVDTDNNGLFDSYTLYSILYQSPEAADDTRTPLQARTEPMTSGDANPACAAAAGTSASLIGGGGWVNDRGILKKSFFTYVATVPITDATGLGNEFETYSKGNKGFSALELQADVPQVPLSNNAVVYDDDVEIFAGQKFTLNGRIFTNSNLFVNDPRDQGLTFRQVSSPDSCFYEEENSKIVVGGNVSYGTIAGGAGTGNVNIHLFQGKNTQPTTGASLTSLNGTNQSTSNLPKDIGYNNRAYEKRIEQLVNLSLKKTLPAEVEADIKTFEEDGLSNQDAKIKALDRYFRKRTRRVPFAEVPYDPNDLDNDTVTVSVEGDGDSLRPNPKLVYPFDPSNGTNPAGYAEVSLKKNGSKLYPAATAFETQENEGVENFIGDRVVIGNNLPELRYENGQWVGKEEPQNIEKLEWDKGEPDENPRKRKTRVTTLADAGDISRNGFWENAAADPPRVANEETGERDKYDPRGGLRVVTSAGLYLPYDDNRGSASNVVWPDWMPVPKLQNGQTINVLEIDTDEQDTLPADPSYSDSGDPWNNLKDISGTFKNNRPFLKMRAAAVYHYTHEEGKEPIACVATYYDPTNWISARNLRNYKGTSLKKAQYDVSGDTSIQPRPLDNQGARSLNGITFKPPSKTIPGNMLTYLSEQVYPNGRRVNPWLYKYAQGDRSLAAQAAHDATNCALQIYKGELEAPTETPMSGYNLPYGAIQETAFLDARQVKAIDPPKDHDGDTDTPDIYEPTGNYDLAIEQRYPLEIRATVIDLDRLRQAQAPNFFAGENEYMLPNSGIIYATRDDALPDASDIELDPIDNADNLTRKDSNPKVAGTDFLLDPTRRPNGIMLVNGARLWRERKFREIEKGLTVASNLPVYIKAQPADDTETLEGFNPHQNPSGEGQQEFTDTIGPLANDKDFYDRKESDLNKNFACRTGDDRLPDCNVGDDWRPANVLSDGITLLSSSFREGFRNEGDYDLRNNQIDNLANPDGDSDDEVNPGQVIAALRLWNGFWNNDFAINGLSSNNTDLTYFPPETKDFPSPPRTPLEDITPRAFPTGQGLTDESYSTNDGTDAGPLLRPLNSTYFNNMVTPVQRRAADPTQYPQKSFPEYVMEYCPKTLISTCKQKDWVIIPNVTSWEIMKRNNDSDPNNNVGVNDLIAGTTASQPTGAAIGKPRRVAFLRDPANNFALVGGGSGYPIPLGIADNDTTDNDADDTVQLFPFGNAGTNVEIDFGDGSKKYCVSKDKVNNCKNNLSGLNISRGAGDGDTISPRLAANALWFATSNGANPGLKQEFKPEFPLFYKEVADENGNLIAVTSFTPSGNILTDDTNNPLTGQPLLVPVLQLQATTALPSLSPDNNVHKNAGEVNWLPRPTISTAPEDTTIFNLVMATKDSPSRPPVGNHEGDIGGALSVLPRFLENWLVGDQPDQAVQIDGSFIQIGRSAYATAPFYQLPKGRTTAAAGGLFNYPQYYRHGNEGKQSAYEAPDRAWGFDVGLLSQSPDLFAQNFAVPPDEDPNLFFREVSRNDEWLEPLLCARTEGGDYAIPNADQRPSSCQ